MILPRFLYFVYSFVFHAFALLFSAGTVQPCTGRFVQKAPPRGLILKGSGFVPEGNPRADPLCRACYFKKQPSSQSGKGAVLLWIDDDGLVGVILLHGSQGDDALLLGPVGGGVGKVRDAVPTAHREELPGPIHWGSPEVGEIGRASCRERV